MSAITLTGNSLNYSMGMGVFNGLSLSFTNAKRSTSSLHDALGTLKSKISVAAAAVSVGTAKEQVQKAQTNEATKKSALTVAYDKLDALIRDTGLVDMRASGKISSREDDFYKKYSYLKPECKKSTGEKIRDWAADRWNDFTNFLSSVGEAIADFAKKAWEWCKENLSTIITVITAAVIIIAAIVICIVCAPEIIAMIAIIVCAASALYGLVDIGFMIFNEGKGIADTLEEAGLTKLAAFFRGLDIGLTVASFILPVGAAIKSIMKLGGKTFLQATKIWAKTTIHKLWGNIKNIIPSIKNFFAGKPGFVGTIKAIGNSLWNGFKSFTGIDDIARLKELRTISNSRVQAGWLVGFNKDNWFFDEKSMSLQPKSKVANDAIDAANKAYRSAGSKKAIKSIPLTNNNGYIDVDWEAISVVTLGKGDGFDFRNLDAGKSDSALRNSIYGNKGSRVNRILNNGLDPSSQDYVWFTSSGKSSSGQYNLMGFTAHENFNLTQENIVPTLIHNSGKGGNGAGLFHIGGIEAQKRRVETAMIIVKSFFRTVFVENGKFASDALLGGD